MPEREYDLDDLIEMYRQGTKNLEFLWEPRKTPEDNGVYTLIMSGNQISLWKGR